MKRPTIYPLLIVACATASAGGQKEPVGLVWKSLQENYLQRIRIFHKGDVQAYAATMTPDFIWKTSTGQVVKTPKSFLRLINAQMPHLQRAQELSFHIDRLNVNGNRAVVVVTQHFVIRQKPKKGPSHTLDGIDVFRETWNHVGPAWKTSRYEEIRGTLTRDGVVIDRYEAH